MTTPTETQPAIPDDLLREITAGVDPVVLEHLFGFPTFVAVVGRAYSAGRAQAFRDAAQMIGDSKPESTNRNLLRALEAYRSVLAAGLRISAKLTESAAEVKP